MAMVFQAKTTASIHLAEDFDRLMSRVANDSSTAISCEDMRNCFFGNYADSSKVSEERAYAEVSDVAGLIATMEGYLVDHNGQNALLPYHAFVAA